MKTVITETIKTRQAALSAKGIAAFSNMDAPSEVLRDIEQECWEMVEAGELVAIDRRDEIRGGLFFDMAR